MILQALNDYYERLLADPKVDVPEFGFANEYIDTVVELSEKGIPVGITVLDEPNASFCPSPAVSMSKFKKDEFPLAYKRTSGQAAYFIADKGEYAIPGNDDSKHDEFKNLAKLVIGDTNDEELLAFLLFLDNSDNYVEVLTGFDEEIFSRRKVAFRLQGSMQFLHENHEAVDSWEQFLTNAPGKGKGTCLILGEKQFVLPVHPSIRNKKGAFATNKGELSIVSFNFDATISYGKKQSFNAPVSERAAFAYTTALNHLLAPDSPRKLRVGETTVVFWADAPGEAEPFFNLAMGGKSAEDEDQARRLEGYLAAVARGEYPEELGDAKTPFYVLGLSPNAARLSVRFWQVSTVGDMAENLGEHYRALALQRRFDSDPEHPSPWQLLRDLAPQRDSRNLSPLLFGQFVRSVSQGLAYPQTLLSAAMGRIRADKEVNYLRTAVIKAFLIRKNNEEITMALNKENRETGYLLGRLFATLERTQNTALGNVNASVRDKYFASAAATPGLVFPILIQNAQHWLSKISKDKEKLARYYNGIIMEIVGGLDDAKGYPKTLQLDAQGLFTIGYYQQMQDFFTKKEKNTEE